jgi:hypothetical protein
VIRQSLNDAGFAEARNVTLDYRWLTDNWIDCRGPAADFVRQQVAVIVTRAGKPGE